MFRLRAAQISDIHDLFELSQMLSFINLPADKALLKKKIQLSLNSFANLNLRVEENTYIFVMEDFKKQKSHRNLHDSRKTRNRKEPSFLFQSFP